MPNEYNNEYLRRIAEGIGDVVANTGGGSASGRVSTLNSVPLVSGNTVEQIGTPIYVSDVSEYADYGITETGWYTFARLTAREGTWVTAQTTVTGAAGHIATVGSNHIDLAVRYEVAAQSVPVTVDWGGSVDCVIFRATDLAIRNLDYRTTFYIYDLAPFCLWTYAKASVASLASGVQYYERHGDVYTLTDNPSGTAVPTYYEHSYAEFTGATFASGVTYYVVEDGEYVDAQVTAGDYRVPYEDHYVLTSDATFADGKTYYVLDTETGQYTVAEVTTGDAVTADTYHEHSYVQTTDTVWVDGKAYYRRNADTYAAWQLVAGESLPTYYRDSYAATTDDYAHDGKTYYTLSSGTYTPAELEDGAPLCYYTHTALRLEGMARNVTYKLDTIIDCPITVILPEVPEDGYGAWFEFMLRYKDEYSMTLTPPDASVKVATDTTPKQNQGINVIDLHYESVAGSKVWRLVNTHSTYTA